MRFRNLMGRRVYSRGRLVTSCQTLASLAAIFLAPALFAAPVDRGEWTMSRSELPSKVHLSLHGREEQTGSKHSFTTSSDWDLADFQKLDVLTSAKHDVQFSVVRDAGRIDGEGFLVDGEGAGLFHFIPDPRYRDEMSKIGFPLPDSSAQFAFAVHNVSLDYAREMKGSQLSNLDANKLLAFRIFGVSSAFITDLKANGLSISNPDKLIAFRIHGVNVELVKTLRQLGYEPDPDKLIAMRIHGASPEWIAELNRDGYGHVDLDHLIAFRIHGVTPEFIGSIEKLGFAHPTEDQLISMKIHGVTPDYIAKLQTHGLKNLTVDRLIELRIQGID